jgi:ankyrin repeat protein
MGNSGLHAVTGAFGYSGKYIAQRLLASGAELGKVEIVEVLLNAGADVNLQNRVNGRTGLMYAAQKHNNDVIIIIIFLSS